MKDGAVSIDGVSHRLYAADESASAKVPDVVFYDNAQHLMVMRDMLQDYNLGEHILLVGNQVRDTALSLPGTRRKDRTGFA